MGAYSQAVIIGDMIYTAGQLGLDPVTGKLMGTDIESQARQALANLEAVISEAGASLNEVVKTTIYLVDLSHFPVVNELYGSIFRASPPARTTVQVAALPLGALVEIEMIAYLPDGSASF